MLEVMEVVAWFRW